MVLPFESIYIIHLKTAYKRKRAIEKHIADLGGLVDINGNEPIWIDANDGNFVNHSIDYKSRHKAQRGRMSRSEVGCFASHRKTWQVFESSNYLNCLILEDDFRINKVTSSPVFENWDKMPEWDYVNFGFIHNQNGIVNSIQLCKHEPFKSFYSGSGMWLTHAYAIQKPIATLFLKETEIQKGCIDWQLTGVQSEIKSFGFANPSVIGQEKVSNTFPSLIYHTQ